MDGWAARGCCFSTASTQCPSLLPACAWLSPLRCLWHAACQRTSLHQNGWPGRSWLLPQPGFDMVPLVASGACVACAASLLLRHAPCQLMSLRQHGRPGCSWLLLQPGFDAMPLVAADVYVAFAALLLQPVLLSTARRMTAALITAHPMVQAACACTSVFAMAAATLRGGCCFSTAATWCLPLLPT